MASPLARQGGIDLTTHDFSFQSELKLDGEWDFFWGKLISAGDRQTVPDAQAVLPDGLWQNIRLNGGAALPSYGYASYRLRLSLGPGTRDMAIRLPELFSAGRVLVNGEELFRAGTVGATAETSSGFFRTGIIRFSPVAGENEIIIQVSNFQERRGGLNRSLVLGPSAPVGESYFRSLAMDLLVFGTLLAMGGYHLFLFWIRRKDKSPLWFGLFCLIIAFRTLLYGERFLFQLLPGLPWTFFNLGDHLSFYLGIPVFGEYIRLIFSKEIKSPLIRIYQVLGLAFSLCLFLPPAVFNTTVVGYEVISALMVLYLVAVMVHALVNHREGALVTMVGIVLFLICGVNEILFNTGVIHTFNSLALGLVFFLFSQAVLLAMRFSRAFTDSERLGQQLQDTNLALRRFIPREFFHLLECDEVTELKLGAQVQKDMSVMFSDIRGFTSLAESMSSSETFDFLNTYFSQIGGAIRDNGGFIDKYLGDGFMTLFPGSADSALRAAVELQRTVNEYNLRRSARGLRPICVGTGLHYGTLVLGTVGEKDRMDTTVIADAVNLASRLEGLTKLFGKGTIVTMNFLDRLEAPENFHWRYLGVLRVPGRKETVEAVHVYDGLPPEEWEAYHATKTAFEEALALYRQGDFPAAQTAFLALAQEHPEDPAVTNYLTRIGLLIKAGLSQDWDGIDIILTK